MKTGTLLVAGVVGAGLVYAITKLRTEPVEGKQEGLEFAAAFQVQPKQIAGPKSVTKGGVTYKQVDSIAIAASIKNTGNVLSPNFYVEVQVFNGTNLKYISKTGNFSVTPGANPTFTFPKQGEVAYYFNGATDAPGDIRAYARLINADTGVTLQTVDSGVLATIAGEFAYTYNATFNISLS